MARHSPCRFATFTADTHPAGFLRGQGPPLLLCHPRPYRQAAPMLEDHDFGGRPVVLLGIGDLAACNCAVEAVVNDVLDRAGWRGAAEAEILGYSAGGFGALLFGSILSLALPSARVSITAFNPLVQFWPPPDTTMSIPHAKVVRVARYFPERLEKLARYGDARPWLDKARHSTGDRLETSIFYSVRSERDGFHARLLEGRPGVELHRLPTGGHLPGKILEEAANRQDLVRIFKRGFQGATDFVRLSGRAADAYLRARDGYPDLGRLLSAPAEPDAVREAPALQGAA